jgi:hypothetical protein
MLTPSPPIEGRTEREAQAAIEVRVIETRSLQLLQPVVDILPRRVFGDAGAFLNLAFKLFALAGNFVEIIIRKMTPP